MSKKYFVTGIGTGIGKTLVSAILVEKLTADYWKPVQAGDLAQSDSLMVKGLISNTKTKIYPEAYRLKHPLSPHLSAKMDDISIDLQSFVMPSTENTLIVEGAGGLMVPLNTEELILDLIKKLNLEVIVVSQNYLGSINHTLLTINTLHQHQITVKGIIFNGEANIESENYILDYTKVACLGKIPVLSALNKETIKQAGENIVIG